MGKVTFIKGKKPFLRDSFVQAVEYPLVKVARLIVHSGHDGIWKDH
jgi:hypothetical protein